MIKKPEEARVLGEDKDYLRFSIQVLTDMALSNCVETDTSAWRLITIESKREGTLALIALDEDGMHLFFNTRFNAAFSFKIGNI